MGRGLRLFEDKKKRYILAPSVLGPNLQLPSHKLISPNSFYEMLNKGKLSAIKGTLSRCSAHANLTGFFHRKTIELSLCHVGMTQQSDS